MRALGLGTKIAAACGAAVALVLALGLPWYGTIPRTADEGGAGDVAGPLDGLFEAVPRWIGEREGLTAWDLPGIWGMVVGGVAVLALLAALLCLLPAAEHLGRSLLQLTAMGVFGLTVVKLFVRPEGFEPRYGIFVALAVSGLLVIIAQGIAAAKLRRKPPAPLRYAGTTTPRRYEHASSVSPPGTR